MALPDFRPAPAFDALIPNAPGPMAAPMPGAITAPLPHAALARLPQLQEESRLALRRAGLLSRAMPAAGLLLAMGTVAALLGGGSLAPTFLWSVLVLGGVIAMVVSHLRTVAVFKDMAGSAADLRAILLYLGGAWGLGAFLALAPEPVGLIAFAVLPALAMTLLLRDTPAILAFGAPVTLFCAAACLLRLENPVAGILLLLAQGAIGLFLLARRRSGITPPGLALH